MQSLHKCPVPRFTEIIVMTLVYMQMHKGVSDPLDVVAAEISDEAIILCLDEFMVHFS